MYLFSFVIQALTSNSIFSLKIHEESNSKYILEQWTKKYNSGSPVLLGECFCLVVIMSSWSLMVLLQVLTAGYFITSTGSVPCEFFLVIPLLISATADTASLFFFLFLLFVLQG